MAIKIQPTTWEERRRMSPGEKLDRLSQYVDIIRETFAGFGEMDSLILMLRNDVRQLPSDARLEMLLDRGYWVTMIELNLWEARGGKTEDSDAEEKIGELVVNEHFMNTIRELINVSLVGKDIV